MCKCSFGWVYNGVMNQQSRMLLTVVIAALIIGVLLGIGGYYLGSRTSTNSVSTVPISSDITPVSTTSSVIVGNQSTSTLAATSTSPAPVDMSDWKTYSNYELGFSFQYPPDLSVDTSNPSAVTLTFPSTYFSTVMTDSDVFSVTVSATCTPEQSFSDKTGIVPSQSTNIGGVTFTEYTQEGAGAGSHDDSMIYTTNNNNVCYTIEYHSHGPNSADAFAGNQSQINTIEASHENDAANIQNIINSIISTFAFINTPAGENEADYSTQQSAAGTGLINLAAVSTSTVSVGGNLTLTGSGFSGNGATSTLVWISNGSVQGILWSGVSSSDTSITATIPTQVCTQNIGDSGATCPAYLILNPGIYTVSVSNQNGTTDPLYIHIQ